MLPASRAPSLAAQSRQPSGARHDGARLCANSAARLGMPPLEWSARMAKNPDGTWDKSRLPSRHVTEGPARAPHRSYYYAMGLGSREIAQPFVGVASCWNQAAPCNTALMR